MENVAELLAAYGRRIGEELHVGEWLLMTQERIDRFADVTGDRQWIHIDPVRAGQESPYGRTVAHGFLTLSLLPYLTRSNHPDFFQRNYPGMRYRVNYGLNRVRFPAPVSPGDRIRARTVLQSVVQVGAGIEIVYLLTVEIENGDKPACVAEQVVRVFP